MHLPSFRSADGRIVLRCWNRQYLHPAKTERDISH